VSGTSHDEAALARGVARGRHGVAVDQYFEQLQVFPVELQRSTGVAIAAQLEPGNDLGFVDPEGEIEFHVRRPPGGRRVFGQPHGGGGIVVACFHVGGSRQG
jgi:hypothetical protein